jgi:hypothetical protein
LRPAPSASFMACLVVAIPFHKPTRVESIVENDQKCQQEKGKERRGHFVSVSVQRKDDH